MKTYEQCRRHFALWMGVYAVMHLPMIILMGITESFTRWISLSGLFIALPLIPMGFALRVFVKGLNTLDDYQQHIQLQAFAISLGCTGMLSFSYGMLEAFAGARQISLIFVLPMMVFFWLVGVVVTKRRYQ